MHCLLFIHFQRWILRSPVLVPLFQGSSHSLTGSLHPMDCNESLPLAERLTISIIRGAVFCPGVMWEDIMEPLSHRPAISRRSRPEILRPKNFEKACRGPPKKSSRGCLGDYLTCIDTKLFCNAKANFCSVHRARKQLVVRTSPQLDTQVL